MNESVEQKARDILERMEVDGAQEMTAGDLTELAGIINIKNGMKKALYKFVTEFEKWKNDEGDIAEMMEAHRLALHILDKENRFDQA